MGGILALVLAFGIVFGARKLCELIRAPRWFAKFLFIFGALLATYFLAEAVLPDSKKSWGVWVAMLGAASGIIPVGFIMFKHIDEEGGDNRKAQDSSRYHSE
jgi:hypothetical protein